MARYPHRPGFVETVRDLKRSRDRLITAAPNPAASSTVSEPGVLSAQSAETVAVFYAGLLSDGTYGVRLARGSGEPALVLAGSGIEPERSAMTLSVHDINGNVIVVDTAGGQGLSRPWLTVPTIPASAALEVATTSATFVDVALLPHFKQQPNVGAFVFVRTSDGTTAGEVRLWDQDNSAQVGDVTTVAAGANTLTSVTSAPYPGAHLALRDIRVQARRTAGTGTVGVRATGYTLGS